MENEIKQTINKNNNRKRNNIILIVVAIIASIVTLYFTQNFVYFVFAALLFLSIYLIINSKTITKKRKIAFMSYIVSGVIAGLSLFAYFYSKWILPFMLNVLHLPALELAKDNDTLDIVANVFLIIGLVFATIALGFFIAWYLFKKKEESIDKENI